MMAEQENARKPASRWDPYVKGYEPWDYPGEPPKTSWLKYLKMETDLHGPYHQKMERALEIRDSHKAGKPLPPLPSKALPEPGTRPDATPEASSPAPEPSAEPIVVVTVRTPKPLHERFRDYAHKSRKTKQGILVEALERYLDDEERKAAC